MPMAEINVTPMVDVMLVLLIIFMVAAPLLTVGVPLELPKTAARAVPTEQEEPLTISVQADGTISIRKKLGSDQICFANLPKKGDAYMLVKSTVDDRYNPKKWHYSEHKKYTKFPSNSDVYGITHSCMVSVDPDNVDKFFYLSNG